MNTNKPFAEVIESSLDTYLAQCWQWNTFPRFGSLVQAKSNNLIILGCVTHIQTGSMDPMRYPFPYQKTEKELLTEQPQIFEFLKTTFQVKVLGYQEENILYLLPPYPCKIHTFIQTASSPLVATFFNKPDFLYLLFSSSHQIAHFDDLLLAILKQLDESKKLTPALLDSFCQTLSLLTGNDYRRMKLFLRRMEETV